MAEELRLEASVVDKFSKPLRDLRNRLNDVKTPEHIKGMGADFRRLETSVINATKSVREGLGQAMVGLSIPSLTAVASIAGIVAAVKSFSSGTIELKAFQRETGLAIGTFKALKHAASSFGVSEDAVGPGLKAFTDNLSDFRRRFGANYDWLLPRAGDFVAKLRESSPDKALDQALDYIEQVARNKKFGPRTAGIVSEHLFGSDIFARFGLQGADGVRRLHEAINEGRKHSDLSKADEDAAIKFDESVEKLRESFSKLSKKVGQEVAPVFGDMLAKINEFIDKNKEKIGSTVADAIHGFGDAVKGVDWKSVGSDIKSIADSIHATIEYVQAWKKSLEPENYQEAKKRLEEAEHPPTKAPSPSPGKVDEWGRRHPMAGSSLLHKSSFIDDGGGSNDTVKLLAAGVDLGLTTFFQKRFPSSGATGQGGGMQPIMASYGGGNVGEHPAVRAIRRAFQGGSGDVEDTGAGRGRGGMPSLSKNQSEAAMRYMDRLVKIHGFTPEAAAIAAGNVGNESGWKPGVPGDGGISHGLHQWNRERFAALQKFAAGRGKPWQDFDTQTDFAALEMQKKIPWTKGQHDFSKAGRWGHLYEGYRTATEGARVAPGQRYYQMWQHHRPADMGPAPGSLLGRRDAQPGPRSREGTAVLHIKLDGNAKTTRADGGTLFHEMHVNRGRSMTAAQET